MGRNNADFQNATPDWQSPWPKGHPNRTEYVSPDQEAKNLRDKDPQRFDELKRNNGVPDYRPEQPVDWKSPWPIGHPNRTEYVKPAGK